MSKIVWLTVLVSHFIVWKVVKRSTVKGNQSSLEYLLFCQNMEGSNQLNTKIGSDTSGNNSLLLVERIKATLGIPESQVLFLEAQGSLSQETTQMPRKNKSLEAGLTWIQILPLHLLVVWSWAIYLTQLIPVSTSVKWRYLCLSSRLLGKYQIKYCILNKKLEHDKHPTNLNLSSLYFPLHN